MPKFARISLSASLLLLLLAQCASAQDVIWRSYKEMADKFLSEGKLSMAEKVCLEAVELAEKIPPKETALEESLELLSKVYQAEHKDADWQRIKKRIEDLHKPPVAEKSDNPASQGDSAQTQTPMTADSPVGGEPPASAAPSAGDPPVSNDSPVTPAPAAADTPVSNESPSTPAPAEADTPVKSDRPASTTSAPSDAPVSSEPAANTAPTGESSAVKERLPSVDK